jgi:hypothetical protein
LPRAWLTSALARICSARAAGHEPHQPAVGRVARAEQQHAIGRVEDDHPRCGAHDRLCGVAH